MPEFMLQHHMNPPDLSRMAPAEIQAHVAEYAASTAKVAAMHRLFVR